MDYYNILGIGKTASDQEIKKAYRKLAQKYHPDVNKGAGSEKKFKEATEAYEVLSDPQKRSLYDQYGAAGVKGGAGGAGFDFSGFGGGGAGFDFDLGGMGGFGDIFESFFGGGGSSRKRSGPQKGADMESRIHISFEEAVTGTEKELPVTKLEECEDCKGSGAAPGAKMNQCTICQGSGTETVVRKTPLGHIQTNRICSNCQGEGKKPETLCASCHGSGTVKKSSSIKIKIPAGISHGTTLRLGGKGEAGLKGGGYGDLFVHVMVASHPDFQRDGADIHSIKEIHMLQATLGDETQVKTIYGDVKLKVPAGTQNGQVFKLTDKGMPKIGSNNKGDHYVKIKIIIPKKVSAKQRELLVALSKEFNLDIKAEKKGLLNNLF